MEFLVISGLSGAGKSRVTDILEDMDYYCVDNMPVALLPKFAELCLATGGKYERVALVTDAREKESLEALFSILDALWKNGLGYRILYLEADKQTIIKRYKETRRPHPLMAEGETIEEAIEREMVLLAPVRERADYIINTSGLTTAMLQSRIGDLFIGEDRRSDMAVTVTAFGYKYGLPMDADLVFDVRFLPNPFYVEKLRESTGLDRPVSDFVFSYEDARDFMSHLTNLMDFLIPLYIEEGKYMLNIAIGCTGGRHRSVAVAKALSEHLAESNLAVS
ncbi:MAG TPA: RNase adapter RapZ, partial [Clostridiales bacterium]|nr:RNase adapter RapZ [Clostridiales bacterium]